VTRRRKAPKAPEQTMLVSPTTTACALGTRTEGVKASVIRPDGTVYVALRLADGWHVDFCHGPAGFYSEGDGQGRLASDAFARELDAAVASGAIFGEVQS
jgi:hypothetical protein